MRRSVGLCEIPDKRCPFRTNGVPDPAAGVHQAKHGHKLSARREQRSAVWRWYLGMGSGEGPSAQREADQLQRVVPDGSACTMKNV